MQQPPAISLVIIRLIPGVTFFLEGIQKFIYTKWPTFLNTLKAQSAIPNIINQ